MPGLQGRAALVTGGSRGIGAAVARRLAADGADVAITYASAADRAAAVVADIEARDRRAIALQGDGRDAKAVRGAVEQAAAELGRLDILVNNAGVFPYGPFEDVTLEELDETLALHVRAAFVAAQAASGHMNGDSGRIITIGSSIAQRVAVPHVALYAMTKTALSGLTRGLARDLGPRGIAVTMVHPGPTDTDMNPSDGPGADEERSLTAFGRYGTADDIAATVAHLAGDGGRSITGAEISVDGGYSA
ncbi:MAG: SDR family oxidoreductase [Thermoleophilaceae bacterium]